MGRRRRESHFSSREVDVGLVGTPPYGLKIGKLIWDLGAFRPDPRDYLKSQKTYSSRVQMETVHLSSGEKVKVPREVEISSSRGSRRFVNVR